MSGRGEVLGEQREVTVAVAARILAVHPDTIRRWADASEPAHDSRARRTRALPSRRHPVTGWRMFRLADLRALSRSGDSL